jgi:hypothetical protein
MTNKRKRGKWKRRLERYKNIPIRRELRGRI